MAGIVNLSVYLHLYYTSIIRRLFIDRPLDKLRSSSKEAVLISLADKLHNARALEEGLYAHSEGMWEKFFQSRKQETCWFYGELMRVYRDRGFQDNWLFIELDRSLKRIFRE